MFHRFFLELRDARVPVSLREYLTLLEALDSDVVERDAEGFYFLARSSLVKDERDIDAFDRVFGHVFRGAEKLVDALEAAELPAEWLEALAQRNLTPEEMAEIESLGGFEKLMEALKERLAEQEKRHEGGSKMIGTAGTSPFGAEGYNPEGVRIGQNRSRHRRAVKVWDQRTFRNLDRDREVGVRNMKLALRRLRQLAREGAPDELDLDETISATARQGYLDLVMRPERRNTAKVVLFLDAGGSMDPFVETCEELFSAASAEFKRLTYYYFHNCLYERVWRDNRRRLSETIPTWDVLHTHPSDAKIIFVGDAAMSPYEIVAPGGSVEHWNEEPGGLWLQRVAQLYPNLAWLNPTAESHWDWTPSIAMVRDIIGADRMYPLTLEGVESAMRDLS